MEKLKVLDLFSGIGGFSLGLERTGGFRTIAFCEIDNYCQRVLHKHWPDVYIHSDIRTLTARHFDGYERPDVICGGFPCQDISVANAEGNGLDGERSGLWFEYLRLLCELRPRYVIVENVSNLLNRGMGRVLGGLAESGYDAEWQCIPASAIGAPHRRDRVFLIAYPTGERLQGCVLKRLPSATKSGIAKFGDYAVSVGGWWKQNSVGVRMGDGIPLRLGKLAAKMFGNTVVPQIPEWIGYRILEAEMSNSACVK